MHSTQLEKIIEDLSYIDVNDDYDADWLAERINIRELHMRHVDMTCDACPNLSIAPVTILVDDYPDDLGSPSTLSVTYLCQYHVNMY